MGHVVNPGPMLRDLGAETFSGHNTRCRSHLHTIQTMHIYISLHVANAKNK